MTGAVSFNSFTDYVSTIDGGRTPFTTLSNPFASGFNTPSNGRDGLLTFLGQTVNAQVRGDRTPYVAQWHFNPQFELREQLLIDVGYSGSAGVKLPVQAQLNQLPDRYLALGNRLSDAVPNPFFGIIPATSALGKATIPAGQLLLPYPQFSSLVQTWGTLGHSSYHALQVKLRKRYRGGLQMLAAYTWSKMLDDYGGAISGGNQNPGYTDNNRRDLDKSVSTYDIPHRLVVSFAYELPFGAGRALLTHKGIMNAVVGGWLASGIATFQSGPPIAVTATPDTTNSFGGVQRPDRTGISSVTPGNPGDRVDRYLNPAAFTFAPKNSFGDAGHFLPENRGPGRQEWDMALGKSFSLYERCRLQFRAAAFNLFNHPNFLGPYGAATIFGRQQFGTIVDSEGPRSVQLSLKLEF
jgi:hypothetical protein